MTFLTIITKRSAFWAIELLLVTCFSVAASPAIPHWQKKTVAGGLTVELRLVGDEFGSWYESRDGVIYDETPDGHIVPAEQSYVVSRRASRQRAERKKVGSADPSFYNSIIDVVLVSFRDIDFSFSDEFKAFLEYENNGSLAKYTQLPGTMISYWEEYINRRLRFNVREFRTDKNHDYYGSNDWFGKDIRKYDLRKEIISYFGFEEDINLVIVFAGKSEAAGGGVDTIWPCCSHLGWSSSAGGTIFSSECSNFGLPAFGTLIHEFGHAMGLPDLYDSDYSENGLVITTPGYYSVMADGGSNGTGLVPPRLSSVERMWIPECNVEPIKVSTGIYYIEPVTNNRLYYFENPNFPDEQVVVEFRPRVSWDACIPVTNKDSDEGAYFCLLDRRSNVLLGSSGRSPREILDSRFDINSYADHPLYSFVKKDELNSSVLLWDTDSRTGNRIPVGYHVISIKNNEDENMQLILAGNPVKGDGATATVCVFYKDGHPYTESVTIDGLNLSRSSIDGVYYTQFSSLEAKNLSFSAGSDYYDYTGTCLPIGKTSIRIDIPVVPLPEFISVGIDSRFHGSVEIPCPANESIFLYGGFHLVEQNRRYVMYGIKTQGFPTDGNVDVSIWKYQNGDLANKKTIVLSGKINSEGILELEQPLSNSEGDYIICFKVMPFSDDKISLWGLWRGTIDGYGKGLIRVLEKGQLRSLDKPYTFRLSFLYKRTDN